jgi:hypothetical protein
MLLAETYTRSRINQDRRVAIGATHWNFTRSTVPDALLICRPGTVSKTKLLANQVGEYLKRNFNAICAEVGEEDTRSGVCLIVSLTTSDGWAIEVQESRETSNDGSVFDPKVFFKSTDPPPTSSYWGYWDDPSGYVGPMRQGQFLCSSPYKR